MRDFARVGAIGESVSKNSVFLQCDSVRLSRVGKAGARKVGTAQSTILLNRKVHASVTDSATENIPPWSLSLSKGEG